MPKAAKSLNEHQRVDNAAYPFFSGTKPFQARHRMKKKSSRNESQQVLFRLRAVAHFATDYCARL